MGIIDGGHMDEGSSTLKITKPSPYGSTKVTTSVWFSFSKVAMLGRCLQRWWKRWTQLRSSFKSKMAVLFRRPTILAWSPVVPLTSEQVCGEECWSSCRNLNCGQDGRGWSQRMGQRKPLASPWSVWRAFRLFWRHLWHLQQIPAWYSEVQLVQFVIDGVNKLIKMEESACEGLPSVAQIRE